MKINIITCIGSFGSLPYVSSIFKDILNKNVTISNKYEPDCLNILIDEAITSAIYNRKADIYWVDTPIYTTKQLLQRYRLKQIENNLPNLYKKCYTTSQINQEILRDLGFNVEDTIIPRPINPEFFKHEVNYNNTDYDIISIGYYDCYDRKNFRLQFKAISQLKLNWCLISNYKPPIKIYKQHYRFGSINDTTKIKLFTKSKFLLWTSFFEGFGMPVLEAMSVGCIPIYTDVPAHNEFAIGIKIPVLTKYKTYYYGFWAYKYKIDLNNIIQSIEQALNLTKEEYQNLSEQCKEKALQIYNNFIDKLNLLLEV